MPLKIYDRNGVWWYRGTVAGRRLHESTRTADKKTAERIANRAEAREFKRDLDGPAAILTFGAAAALYLDASRSDRFLKPVLDHWKNTLVKDITPGAIKLAAIKVYPKAGPATRNRQFITPTVAVINHAATLELCPALMKVDRFPVPRKRRDEADWQWVQALAANAPKNLAALAMFGFVTGSRISNITALEWSAVDFDRREAVLWRTKNGHDHVAHLPPALIVALANLETDRNGKVFGYSSRHSIKSAWNASIKRAKIKELTPHALRHGFATGLLRAGIDPVTVAWLGGWESAQLVVDTYGHAMKDRTVTNRLTGPLLHQQPEAAAELLMKTG
ncbi:site-specific integrase [Mesorhizobium caraganae]|uniref:site-specific integrase n=1 Tax=Mesorhizobium caraganae TaxID=483206 RepID=UPI0017859FD2|nr:site-specific integrase [Mesorhizobium caraganae]